MFWRRRGTASSEGMLSEGEGVCVCACVVRKFTSEAEVLPDSISFGDTVSKCLLVLLSLRKTLLAVEKDCNLGTFEAAFKGIANIRVCAEFAELDSNIQKIQQLLPPPAESGWAGLHDGDTGATKLILESKTR